jgi:hypothetical protein
VDQAGYVLTWFYLYLARSLRPGWRFTKSYLLVFVIAWGFGAAIVITVPL